MTDQHDELLLEDDTEAFHAVPHPEPEIPSEPIIDVTEDPRTSQVPTIPQLLVAVTILASILGYPYVRDLLPERIPQPEQAPTALVHDAVEYEPHATEAVDADKTQPTHTQYEDLSLEAKAIYVWDVRTQRALFQKNTDAQLPLASLTKLMTALVAYETYGEFATVPISLDAIRQEGENGFEDGEVWSAKSLLDFTLITSSNDGAFALAAAAGKALDATRDPEEVFLEHMNKKAKELGLTQTYFTNPTGLDTSEAESGSYGSARDMAFLMEYILKNHPEVLESTNTKVARFLNKQGEVYTAENTNQSVTRFANLLGSKTGYTLLAGGNLVVSLDIGLNHPVIISVLGSSREGRFRDVSTLAEHTIKSFNDSN